MKKISLFIGFFALLIPISYSDGGCIKLVDGILVQLSSAPVAPVVGKQVSYLFSFGNDQGLIAKEINGTLKIVKNDVAVFTKDFKINDGILDLKHVYENPGLYEIFFEFQIGNKNYKPEDFLIEVVDRKTGLVTNLAYLIIGITVGAVFMKLYTRKYKPKK